MQENELISNEDIFDVEVTDEESGNEEINLLDEKASEPNLKLDYSIESSKERTELVKKIVDSLPPEKLTNRYLEVLANYMIFAMDKE